MNALLKYAWLGLYKKALFLGFFLGICAGIVIVSGKGWNW